MILAWLVTDNRIFVVIMIVTASNGANLSREQLDFAGQHNQKQYIGNNERGVHEYQGYTEASIASVKTQLCEVCS